jgi:hypothetical protein
MTGWMSAVVAVALAGVAAPAAAAEAPLSLDCDTAGGAYSELKQVLTGPAYSVAGRMTFERIRVDRRWLPVGSAQVASADAKRRVMLQVSAPKRDAGPLQIWLLVLDGDEENRQILGEAEMGSTMDFVLRVDNGRAAAEIGPFKGEAAAPAIGSGGSTAVGCSTGQVLFEELKLSPGR